MKNQNHGDEIRSDEIKRKESWENGFPFFVFPSFLKKQPLFCHSSHDQMQMQAKLGGAEMLPANSQEVQAAEVA